MSMMLGKQFKLALVVLASLTASLFANPLVASAQRRAPQQAAKPAQIDKNGLLILIRSTLYALDLSNKGPEIIQS